MRWRHEIGKAMGLNVWRSGTDHWGNVQANTLSEAEMDEVFGPPGDYEYDAPRSPMGKPFTVWTRGYVYFPAWRDGVEYVASVPCTPNGSRTEHIGGGVDHETDQERHEQA